MTTSKPAPRRAPRASTAKVAAAKPSIVDEMAEEAEAPEEYPPGTPEFLVPLAIRPRSRRAEFKRRYALVLDKYEKMREFKDVIEAEESPPPPEQMRIMAELDDVLQSIDDTLRLAAVDEAKYTEWSDSLEDDDQLMQVFHVFQKRSQPGEASSSTS